MKKSNQLNILNGSKMLFCHSSFYFGFRETLILLSTYVTTDYVKLKLGL